MSRIIKRNRRFYNIYFVLPSQKFRVTVYCVFDMEEHNKSPILNDKMTVRHATVIVKCLTMTVKDWTAIVKCLMKTVKRLTVIVKRWEDGCQIFDSDCQILGNNCQTFDSDRQTARRSLLKP